MIDWVHERCQQWSTQYRTREHGGLFPPQADIPAFLYQHNPEMLSAASQEVSQAVFRMRATRGMEGPYAALVAHELFAGKEKQKARALGWDMPAYWRSLHAAHCFIAARIEQPLRETA